MDTGTTAFMLCCIIGLTIMIPGLALFYGGMISVKSSINMMMLTFGAVAIVGVLWVLLGFSMTFGNSHGGFVEWRKGRIRDAEITSLQWRVVPVTWHAATRARASDPMDHDVGAARRVTRFIAR